MRLPGNLLAHFLNIWVYKAEKSMCVKKKQKKRRGLNLWIILQKLDLLSVVCLIIVTEDLRQQEVKFV